MKQTKNPLAGKALADFAAECALEKKAEKILVLNLQSVSGLADWFVICQSDNPVHGRAIADAICDNCARRNTRPWHVEGLEQGRWVLIDYADVVVHVMIPDVRHFYQLEDLWDSCPRYAVDDPA